LTALWVFSPSRFPEPFPSPAAQTSVFNLKIICWWLALAGLMSSALAQDISFSDAGLEAAVRDALQKPTGPLNERDLLSLIVVDADRRNVKSIGGLEAAHNLVSLDLEINQLTNFSLPPELTNLSSLDLSVNPLTNVFIPNGMANLAKLIIEGSALTNLDLPTDLTGLESLDLANNQFTRFDLSHLTGLANLDLGFNHFTDFSLPVGLTNLETLVLQGNLFTNFTVPAESTGLVDINLSENQLARFVLPAGLTNLLSLNLSFNQLTNVTLPSDLRNLTKLNLNINQLSSLNLSSNLVHLAELRLRANQFTHFTLPAGLPALTLFDLSTNPLSSITLPAGLNQLTLLRLSENKLTNLTLPAGMTNLTSLNLSENQLTNLVLPSDLHQLQTLNLGGNQLTSLSLPSGLTNLTGLFVTGNNLTNLTLPPDMTQLSSLGFLANPLTTLVLPEPLADTILVDTVASLRSQGVSVFTYPLTVELISPQQAADGAFEFLVTGPPGIYMVQSSDDLAIWNELGAATNSTGTAQFRDTTPSRPARRFYRALQQSPVTTPTNMVFIPANTFTLGSPSNEIGRSADEGPQTIVTFSRGFWMAKFLVTQRDYLAVMGTNPSGFPGNLDRPVESVSWFDATNYCAKLTQQDLTAGRIPPGTHYRLPTEAEWECAARAGTTTRFNYGDDPNASSLTNHAWYSANSGFVPRPVGLKEPNAWGLYDMEGNVWEWCQDWYGPYAGGSVTDPQGPASNATGFKVIRGGAWESFDSDCRSARRSIEGASPFISDFIIGFRVVLAFDP
jgi:formylglycine-generating enzyme required for sulfatase activity